MAWTEERAGGTARPVAAGRASRGSVAFESAAAAAAWRPSIFVVLGWAMLVALIMSLQLLFQPFVWRNWPWEEVIDAWLEVAAQRGAVAFVIALALFGAWSVPTRSVKARAVLLAAAIPIGASIAEAALAQIGVVADRSFGVRLFNWSVMSGSVAMLFYLWRRGIETNGAAQAALLRRAQLERQIVQSRLQALRSQIEPHFLFNTLATLRSLQRIDPRQGDQLLVHLLDYLRATVAGLSKEDSTLGSELDLVRGYLGVVTLRMSGRLVVNFDVADELLDCEFPALTVATLVENAIKHGLAPTPAGGTLQVSAQREGDALEVCVADTGVGFSGGSGGSGIGLANVRARLHTLHGSAGVLTLKTNRPSGVRASIRLPYQVRGAAA